MKKNILEEIENMRYLLGYKKGIVISEQEVEKDDMIDKYSSKSISNSINSGNFANLNPAAADAIKKAQNMVGGQSVLPNATTGAPAGTTATAPAGTTATAGTTAPAPAGTTTTATKAPEATTQAAPVTPIKIGVKYPDIETLQNLLKTKFQADLTPDGKYGPKTAASVLAALQKLPVNSTETKTNDTSLADPSKAAQETAKVAQTGGNTNGTATGTKPTAGTTAGSGVISVNIDDITA